MGSDIHDAFTGRVNSLRAWGRPGGPSNNPDGHGTHVCGCTHSHAAVILHTLQLGATLRPRRLPPRPGPLRLVRQRAATAHSQSTAFPVASSPATMSSSSSGTGGGVMGTPPSRRLGSCFHLRLLGAPEPEDTLRLARQISSPMGDLDIQPAGVAPVPTTPPRCCRRGFGNQRYLNSLKE